MKVSKTGLQARDSFIRGAKYLSSSVGQTLGPFGQNAYLEHNHKITNDGFSISAELANTLEDEVERQGALALHEASSKTNDEVGDSTTSVQVLAQAIIDESLRYLPNDKSLVSKKKPSEIVKMIDESKKNVIELLKEGVKQIETEADLIKSAKVSVEDDELAKMIGETQWKIGKNGVILVDETLDNSCSVEIVKGIRLDNGFASSNLITDEANQSANIDDISVILTNYTLGVEEIVALKDKIINPLIAEKKNKLAIIARAFTPDALKLCKESIDRGFVLWALNAPYTNQGEIMRDLSVITGAVYYDSEERRLEDLSIQDVGHAKKILARRWDAIVTGNETDLNKMLTIARVNQLKEKLSGSISDFDRKMIETRIAQFEGGFAILKIGAETVVERKFKKDKADDAVNSVRLALQGGVIKGGGLALKEVSDKLPEGDILKRPLLSINNQIMSSAPEGFVIENWVNDPYLTTVSALTNACSVAGQFSTIQIVVTTQNPPKCKHNE